jgi:hypothetical protein
MHPPPPPPPPPRPLPPAAVDASTAYSKAQSNWCATVRLRYFVFTSFWNYKFYYVYGFMLLVFIILLIERSPAPPLCGRCARRALPAHSRPDAMPPWATRLAARTGMERVSVNFVLTALGVSRRASPLCPRTHAVPFTHFGPLCGSLAQRKRCVWMARSLLARNRAARRYFLLNAEDYRWQWISFLSSASTALYASQSPLLRATQCHASSWGLFAC